LIRELAVLPRQMAVLRDDPAGAAPVVIAANASDADATIALGLTGTWQVVWSTTAAAYGGPGTHVRLAADAAGLRCELPPWCAAVGRPA
jgi:hypothetical protein